LAQSGGYPSKPIKIIVPYVAGGPSDLFARAVGQLLTEAWGQPADRRQPSRRERQRGRTGGSSVPRRRLYAHHRVDRVRGFAGHGQQARLRSGQDLAPISLLASINNLLVVNPNLPVKSVKELIAFARARPGQVTFASGGAGGAQHLSGELFSNLANVKMTHIPYKGSAPGVTALISGETMIGFADMVITLPHVKSGRLRALAVTGSQRSALVPELPTDR
jgi:tripartite-type tricarboxylate transporter receptor subunit TctC